VQYSLPARLPTRIKRWTVLKSPFVNKRHRDQFEIRWHSMRICLNLPIAPFRNAEFADAFDEWLRDQIVEDTRKAEVTLTKTETAATF